MMQPKGYGWDAKDYAKNSQNQFQWAQELIPKLKLRGDEALLDVGCGDGKITAELAQCLPQGRAVGVDSSVQMINLAKAAFSSADYGNLCFQVMDAQNLTFPPTFDVVFSNAALHWIVNQKPVLCSVYKSLKPTGHLLFQMAGKGNAKDILVIIDELSAVEPWNSFLGGMAFPYGFYDTEEYEGFLQETGFAPTRLALFPKDMKFNGAEGLAGWVRTTWLPFTDRLPVEFRPKFVDQIVSRYLELHPTDAAGTVHVGMMRLEVEATKQ